MVQGYEEAEHLRSVLHGLSFEHQGEDWKIAAMDHTKVIQLTDCRSLESYLNQPGGGTTGDKRLAIDLRYLRQAAWRKPGELDGDPLYGENVPENGTTRILWVETKTMLADALTKKMKTPQLDLLLQNGWLEVDTDKSVSKKAESRNRSMAKKNDGCEIRETDMHVQPH